MKVAGVVLRADFFKLEATGAIPPANFVRVKVAGADPPFFAEKKAATDTPPSTIFRGPTGGPADRANTCSNLAQDFCAVPLGC